MIRHLVISLLLSASSVFGAPFDCLAGYMALGPDGLESFTPQPSYFVQGNKKNPVSFGYEVEFFLGEAPGLVKFYRVPEIPHAEWKAMSIDSRVAAAEKKIKSVNKNDVALVRMEDAPSFLDKTAIREATTDLRVEISDNQVTGNLGEVFRQFDWIEYEIGKGYPQGHVAFRSDGVNSSGAPVYLKMDGDLAMVNSITHSYRSFQSNIIGREPVVIIADGKRVTISAEGVSVEGLKGSEAGQSDPMGRYPARALLHRSLGPMNASAFETLTQWTGKEQIPDMSQMSRNTKFNYGIVLRPDLYGEGKSGFEIRNPGARFKDLKFRMAHLTETLSEGFGDYQGMEVSSTLVGPGALAQVPPKIQPLYRALGRHLSQENEGQNFSTPFAERFTFPHLQWMDHPYIKALPEQSRLSFQKKLSEATAEYNDLVAQLPKDPKVLPAIQVSIGKWSAQSEIRRYLELGARAAAIKSE